MWELCQALMILILLKASSIFLLGLTYMGLASTMGQVELISKYSPIHKELQLNLPLLTVITSSEVPNLFKLISAMKQPWIMWKAEPKTETYTISNLFLILLMLSLWLNIILVNHQLFLPLKHQILMVYYLKLIQHKCKLICLKIWAKILTLKLVNFSKITYLWSKFSLLEMMTISLTEKPPEIGLKILYLSLIVPNSNH